MSRGNLGTESTRGIIVNWVRVTVVACAMSAVIAVTGCSETEPCGQDYVQVSEVYASGIAVSDTLDVGHVIQAYSTYMKSKGLVLPDGSTGWLYDSAFEYPKLKGVQYWQTYYRREDTGEMGEEPVYVDQDGRIVRLEITIHAPC